MSKQDQRIAVLNKLGELTFAIAQEVRRSGYYSPYFWRLDEAHGRLLIWLHDELKGVE
jgi:hypothetical protein